MTARIRKPAEIARRHFRCAACVRKAHETHDPFDNPDKEPNRC